MFCRHCGKELLDEAVLCPNCGKMVKKVDFSGQQTNGFGRTDKQADQEKIDKRRASLSKTFGVTSSVFIWLSLAMTISGIVDYIYYMAGYSSSTYGAYMDTIVSAVVMGLIALGFGITSFVWGIKQKNYAVKYISTIIFVASIFAVFIPLICG